MSIIEKKDGAGKNISDFPCNDPICYIVGAGKNYGLDFRVKDGDFVIAADGGFAYVKQQGINPDLVIGDFDSLGDKPGAVNAIILESEKDDTDTLAAVREGMARGLSTFYIYCGTGGRFDHTLANIQTLAFLSQNGKIGYLVDRNLITTIISNSYLMFDSCCTGYISVFAYSESAKNVSIKGLKYELDNAVMTNVFPVGVSNEFIGKKATIEAGEGMLMIVFPRECKFANIFGSNPSPGPLAKFLTGMSKI